MRLDLYLRTLREGIYKARIHADSKYASTETQWVNLLLVTFRVHN